MNRWLLALAALVSACGDLGPLGSVQPGPREAAVANKNIPPDTSGGMPTAPSDPAPQWPVRITSVDAYMHMPGFYAGNGYPGEMRLTGTMTYDAYHAEIGLNLGITGPDGTSRSLGPAQKHTSAFFGNSHWAEWTHYVRSPCGNTIHADFSFRAWWIGNGGWEVDPHRTQRSLISAQESCPSDGGGGPGSDGSGDGGTVRCYTLVTDHYEYDPATGETRYLYTSEEEAGCEYID
jgi:hypothetical protein